MTTMALEGRLARWLTHVPVDPMSDASVALP